ncbi:VanZ family protein [Sutcliffiella halmapala]|uniref:VanZ family protein n=1 Tax=Sutcliffiella halmapala TaxID=79882 RepID=UPI00099598A1|nr:VanZ family protein [Sutcliffiella halmapala]
MQKRRMYYYLLLASGWTVLLFHLSSMSYVEQDIRPYLKLVVTEESIQSWFRQMEFSYNGSLISVENLGGFSFLEFLIRKGAHLFFYYMLGFVIVRYFSTFLENKPLLILLLSCSMLLIIAMMDEYLQHLHPDRSGQWMDVQLNCLGGVIGIVGGFITSLSSVNTKKSADHSM